jgi:hypothetical protein
MAVLLTVWREWLTSGRLDPGRVEWRHNSLPLGTNANLAPFKGHERFIKLAPQSAFTRAAIQQSQAAYAGA